MVDSSLKTISKVLANSRFAPKLKILIDVYQTGFIAERNILEGIITAYEE